FTKYLKKSEKSYFFVNDVGINNDSFVIIIKDIYSNGICIQSLQESLRSEEPFQILSELEILKALYLY
ncbi:hypothetical protein BpHYR1_021307, partial [Brachionus plicatilis]